MWVRFLASRTGFLLLVGIGMVGVALATEGALRLVGIPGLALVVVGLLRRTDAHMGDVDSGVAALARRVASIEDRFGVAERLLEEQRSLIEMQSSVLEHVRRESEEIVDRVDAADQRITAEALRTERLAGVRASVHQRDLDEAELRALLAYWNPRLGTTAGGAGCLSVLHRVRSLEAISVGRIATTITDILIRCLVGEAAGKDDVELCEVGVLFGLGGLVVLDHVLVRSRDARLTIIDPFSGYYGEDTLDPPTALPVTRSNLERNARLFGVGEQRLRIIQGLSTDDRVLAEASDREYHVMIYDGDHSYDGIRRDHERYSGLVRPCGFLVIDDYGTDRWPDVTRYTDEVIARDERFEFVGAGSRTAVYRRRAADRTGSVREDA